MTLDELKQVAEGLPEEAGDYVKQKASTFLSAVKEFEEYAESAALSLEVSAGGKSTVAAPPSPAAPAAPAAPVEAPRNPVEDTGSVIDLSVAPGPALPAAIPATPDAPLPANVPLGEGSGDSSAKKN